MRVLYDPEPRATDEIFSPEALAALRDGYQVTEWQGQDREAFYTAELPRTEILISQQPMGADRLALAPKLRAIFNVETNFLPNIDYDECFRRGIHVLAPGAVFAAPVAEMALGMALSLARNIHGEHAAFLRGEGLRYLGIDAAGGRTRYRVASARLRDRVNRGVHETSPYAKAPFFAPDPKEVRRAWRRLQQDLNAMDSLAPTLHSHPLTLLA